MAQPYDMPLEELRKYKPALTRQPDFDEFWKKSLDSLASVPLEYKLVPYDYPVRGVKVYSISFKSFEGASMDGWFALPEGSGLFPGIAMFHGYNWCFGSLHDTVSSALRGYATLHLNVRGQQGRSVDNVISSNGFNAGWMSKGIMSPEEYYYRAVYMDVVRAVEILASMPEVEAKKIGVAGGSQGGGLTLAAAALSDIPVVAIADNPYLSNFERAMDIAPNGPYLELNEFFRRNPDTAIEEQAKKTLSYFDIMNHAQNINCHTWICVGLVDEITPPSTIFSIYNNLGCSKEISIHRYFGHEYIPATVEPKMRLLMKYLQS